MPNKRLTIAAALVSVLLAAGPLQAKNIQLKSSQGTSSPAESSAVIDAPVAQVAPHLLSGLAVFNPTPMLVQSIIPTNPEALLAAGSDRAVAGAATKQLVGGEQSPATIATSADVTDLRKALIAMAMKLRDTRYVRGGRDPSTGFDCSGFVRYVFAHAVGMQLPSNSASQFLAGLKVQRSDMQPGDLVFFRTHGKRRISHVGIYISNGRFIHSPNTGKSVEISTLASGYWAKRFAGAKRPEAMASVGDKG